MNRICIHSVPRSGSTWLGEIFNSHPLVNYNYQPLFSYAFKGFLTPKSSQKDIYTFYKDIAISNDDFLNQTEARQSGKLPSFEKPNKANFIVYKEVRYHNILRNLLEQAPDIRVIGLIRNPLSVINSWLNAPKEFRKDLGWDELSEWQYANKKNDNRPEEFNGFEKWKEVSNLFLEFETEFPNQFKIISYSELLKHTDKTVSDIFKFCNLNLDNQTINFINQNSNSGNKDAYSVYKVKNDDNSWKKSLSPQIINKITTDLKNTTLEKYLD